MDCENCKNYCPTNKPTYTQFHVDRIVRILESGDNPVELVQNNHQRPIPHITLFSTQQKISWIVSSLFELGVIRDGSSITAKPLAKLNWKKFEWE